MAKKPRYYRAKTSFVITENGMASESVSAGELFHPDHPYTKRYSDQLEPTDTFGRFDCDDTETATAAPGEKRNR
jgi:hypothetical protein